MSESRCYVTGNPCGTDTWPAGRPCQCGGCQSWLCSEIARLTEERDALLEVVRDAGKQGSGYAYRQRAEQIAAAMGKAKT